ncbi:MAG: hypothetical protein KAQ94_04890 [Arcobacteraceae bacterium]|nr:hypothetical protein [Arcobacteraceae bacterium]
MSNINFNFITTSKIQIVTISVTEKINSQFLQEFLKTTLESKNILTDNTTLIWHSFIEEINLYEIYVINSTNNDIDIYPAVLSQFYDNTKGKDTIDLFILNDFFAVYKYGKLYCFKSVKDSSTEDIQNYITQTYKLTLDNIIKYDDAKFSELLNSYKINKQHKKKPQFINLKQNNSFLLFIIFSFSCIVSFLFILFNTYNHNLQNMDNKLLKLQIKYDKLKNKKITYEKIAPKLIEIFKYIKLENIITQKINYEKHKIKLDLLHQDETKLLNFLTIYNDKIFIENIEFIKKDKLYKMVVKIAI